MGVMHDHYGYAYSTSDKSASVPYALFAYRLLSQNGSPGHIIM